MEPFVILAVGLGAGLLYGVFGAGGSAFATPVLALAGVPGVFAVAAPLPSMLPASMTAARDHLRRGDLDTRVARLAVAGGLPGTLLGGLASDLVGGTTLLALSGLILLAVGVRIVLPDPQGHADRCARRLGRPGLVVGVAFAVGVLTGLLANGGGFLLVPAFIVVLGLSTAAAAGTSLVVAGALSVPTLAIHWSLGHIDWRIALLFAAGSLPGTVLGVRMARRLPVDAVRRSFGVLLIVFAASFLLFR